jgi:hypothetical protein
MSTPLGCDEKSSRVNGDMVNVTDSTGKTWKISNQNLFANLPISENPFDIDDLTEITSLEDDDYFAVLDDTDGQHKKISKDNLESEIGGSGSGGSEPYVLLRDVKSAGTSGGTFTSGARRTRDLNQELVDTDNLCTLSSNQFTLPAGTYRIKAHAPAYKVNRHRISLRNISDSVDVVLGTSEFSHASDNTVTRSFCFCQLTISASKTFEIQHQCQTTANTFGFGVDSNFSEDEIYTIVEIWKVGE